MEICFACPQFAIPAMCINSYRTKSVTITRFKVLGNNLTSLWEKQECKILQIFKVTLTYTKNVSQAISLNTSNILVFARNIDLNLTGSMSSHTRQPFPLSQVQCRVTLDRPVRCSRWNVESHSTALSAVPGPMSSSNRHVILQCLILVFPKQLLYSGCCRTSNIIELGN
jgi:hypothetical protein